MSVYDRSKWRNSLMMPPGGWRPKKPKKLSPKAEAQTHYGEPYDGPRVKKTYDARPWLKLPVVHPDLAAGPGRFVSCSVCRCFVVFVREWSELQGGTGLCAEHSGMVSLGEPVPVARFDTA